MKAGKKSATLSAGNQSRDHAFMDDDRATPMLTAGYLASDACAPLMTPREVAGVLRIDEDTLSAWRSNRRQSLPFVKLGRLVRYRRADVDRFVAGHLQAA